MLHGFDSSEGLPESWMPLMARVRSRAAAQIAEVPDRRVGFFKAQFERTLPNEVFPRPDVLAVNTYCGI
jgi:hypothetical protein